MPGDAFPNTTITPSGTVNGVQVLHLDLAGSATDDLGVSAVRVTVEETDSSRYVQPNGTLSATRALLPATLGTPGGTLTTWTLSVNLPTEGDYDVTAIAFDTSDQQDPSSSGAESRYPIYPGDLPPTVTEALFAPSDGAVFTDGRIFVSGRLEDDQSIAQAQVAIRNGAGQYMSSSGHVHEHERQLPHGVPQQPRLAGIELLVHDADDSERDVHGARPRDRSARLHHPGAEPASRLGDGHDEQPAAGRQLHRSAASQNVCTFDGRTSTDENAPTLTYSWNFGSGSGSGPLPTRTYTSANTYTVTLTVRDENGQSGVTAKTVTIVEPTNNVPPVPVINPPACAARVLQHLRRRHRRSERGRHVQLPLELR